MKEILPFFILSMFSVFHPSLAQGMDYQFNRQYDEINQRRMECQNMRREFQYAGIMGSFKIENGRIYRWTPEPNRCIWSDLGMLNTESIQNSYARETEINAPADQKNTTSQSLTGQKKTLWKIEGHQLCEYSQVRSFSNGNPDNWSEIYKNCAEKSP